MNDIQPADHDKTFVAFIGTKLISRGVLTDVARAVKGPYDDGTSERIALFDEETGRPVDVDFSGSGEEVVARLCQRFSQEQPKAEPKRGPGRPKLGVVSREVSLLPRHWDWLGQQRGGASASLRRLVDAARKANAPQDKARQAIDATHRFLWDMAGDQPGFEEATRALFAQDFDAFDDRIASWPIGLREQLHRFTAKARHA